MTTRTVVSAWLCAILISVVIIIGIIHLGIQNSKEQLTGKDAVFLGTSLTRFALPNHFEPMPLAQVGAENAVRIGLSLGTESDLLHLASAAIDARVRSVFIEINPLISRFSNAPKACSWHQQFLSFRRLSMQSTSAILRGKNIGQGLPQNEVERSIDLERLDQLYPIDVNLSCRIDQWREVVRTSWPSNLYFIAMPRDYVARDYIGTESMADFYATAEEFSAKVGAPLFIVDAMGVWPAEDFIDLAHLSISGSEHFLERLDDWWGKLQ